MSIKKIARGISIAVLSLALLSVFGYLISESSKDESSSGLSGVINSFVSFPGKVMEVLESKEIRNIPPTFAPNLELPVHNNLKQDVFGLNGQYNLDRSAWDIRLFNFRTDEIVHQWQLNEKDYDLTTRQYPNAEPRNCILLEDRGLIVANDESKNLYRLDSASNIVWKVGTSRFHHSMNLDSTGSIWISGTEMRHLKTPNVEVPVRFEDELIFEINLKDGSTRSWISLTDILIENNLVNFVFGFSNDLDSRTKDDPLHLNDIEPVLADGPYWKKGDLFLSLRHRSLVFLYRPSTRKIIRLIFGPFLNQHDVDIISDHEISIFNNNAVTFGKPVKEGQNVLVKDSVLSSDIMTYNFADSSFSMHFKHHFDAEQIYTHTQGFHHWLSNGDVYIEAHKKGILYFMNEKEIVYKSQLNNRLEDWVERPHWLRIYENIDF